MTVHDVHVTITEGTLTLTLVGVRGHRDMPGERSVLKVNVDLALWMIPWFIGVIAKTVHEHKQRIEKWYDDFNRSIHKAKGDCKSD